MWTKFSGVASLLLLTSLAIADDTGGTCTAPPAPAAKATSVDVPDYAADADSEVDARAAHQEAEWQAYRSSLIAGLRASADPRDWAIAEFAFTSYGKATLAVRPGLQRAVAAAPNDALVLWMTLSAYRTIKEAAPDIDATIRRLEVVEPDNAAVWMETLTQAATRNDRAGVTAAIARMATSSRFDNHLAEMGKLVAGVYARQPPPDSYLDALPVEDRPSRENAARMIGDAATMAFALPAFQYIVNACRTDDAGHNADRAADCATAGRLMQTTGDSLIANLIGLTTLRVSRQFDENDLVNSRDFSWVYSQHIALTSARGGDHSPVAQAAREQAYIAFHDDWIDSGQELEAMRRSLQREGIAPTPPADWKETKPRFSADAIAADASYLANHPVDY